MGTCQNHVKECSDGTYVRPDPFNNCEWHSCPYDQNKKDACTQDMGRCPSGHPVSRDLNNGCKFARCRDGYVYLGNEITEGQKILSGEGLLSDNRKYKAVMQTNGIFVVYQLDYINYQIMPKPLWYSYMNEEHTLSDFEGRFMVYQNDNNFCMYAASTDYQPRWCTMNDPFNAPTGVVIMQDDSTLCVYDGYRRALWSSYDDGGIYGSYQNSGVPVNVEIMGVVLALLCIINIFVGAYFYCCNNRNKKTKEVNTFQSDDESGLIY